MDLNLQPLSQTCHVTSQPFTDGLRVASYLVQSPHTPEILRFDLLETATAEFTPPGSVVCSWVQIYKARKSGENPDRALKFTAENLFLTLTDPATEPTEENARLVQFLALMLERKRILKLRGLSADRTRQRYEHTRLKQMIEIPAGELTPEFFVQVQEQLSVLVGVPKVRSKPVDPMQAAASATESPKPKEEEPSVGSPAS